ncbi:uncharacterized protein LAESUDRAFT_653786 [Laetiporus sulphureus 93-53]|uniref:RINT-1 family protein n=1 Tax=Laetiporus sulphureus 93-53 TaxID=1314785 RepID=A0A165E5Y3_9APHY|nr:uncharacterized protein LAESUDRAFT_653786 [Laetiporus sulphureus 93-53]KZT06301.1 hypothetical protein LAESUDRAFT_653786 [Laetiporus sulphureus 93-53]
MASGQIQELLQGPDIAESEKRALDFLDARFTSLQDIEDEAGVERVVQDAIQHSEDMKTQVPQLSQSRQVVNALIVETRASAELQLHTAQEPSLLRHSLSDELSYLSQQLVSSLGDPERKPTLLEDLETLHRSLKEVQSVKGYVQIVQQSLKLSELAVDQIRSSSSLSSVSEYEGLQEFVASVHQVCAKVEDVAGEQELHILSFLESIRERTWADMRHVLSTSLLSAAEKLHWPMVVDYLSATTGDRKAFEAAFSNMSKLQKIGKQLHSAIKGKEVAREGLYPIQALVQPISLRFKYHFEGERQTNRLDKPEWYFTHVLNVSHEHRPFMENVVQTFLSDTQYRNINAWREFTLLLLPLLERKLHRTMPTLLAHPSLLAHTIYEALAFDSALREENFDINDTTAGEPSKDGKKSEGSKWQGISDVILGRKEWFEAWMEGERKFTMDQYIEIISASDAWLIADDEGDTEDAIVTDRDLRPTNSARRVKALVEQVTDRYSPLPQFLHRTRFLIVVQLPILESYHSRISSSLDAYETLSSSLIRAVPGALGSVSDASGRVGDPKSLTSGVEGVQRLCKALVSAKYISAACEAWGEDLFFLELWAEINHRASLRSQIQAASALPNPKGGETEAAEGTIFEELIMQYGQLAERAEDMIVQSVCGEVEVGLRAHFSNGSSTQVTPNVITPGAQDDIALAPTLLGPLALLSSHISFLSSALPRTTVTSLYRRIASRLAMHIYHRQILYHGRGRITPQEGRAIRAESELWVETCQVALARSDRARAEGPWRQLLQASRLVGAEGKQWQEILDATFGVIGDEKWEGIMLETVGFSELSREEVSQVLRARSDCGR